MFLLYALYALYQGLRELFFGTQDYPSPNILVSGMRSKLLPHLALARPLSVEYPLNTVNTPELFALRYLQSFLFCILFLIHSLLLFIYDVWITLLHHPTLL